MKRDGGPAGLVDGDYDQVVQKIPLYRALGRPCSPRPGARRHNRHLDQCQGGRLQPRHSRAAEGARPNRLRLRCLEGRPVPRRKARVLNPADRHQRTPAPLSEDPRRDRRQAGQPRQQWRHVAGKHAIGLVLRNSRGLTATVSDRVTGRLPLGSGRTFTIDAAQGMSTKGEHINALSRGTAAASAFKMYTAETRATGRRHTMISKGAVLSAVLKSARSRRPHPQSLRIICGDALKRMLPTSPIRRSRSTSWPRAAPERQGNRRER